MKGFPPLVYSLPTAPPTTVRLAWRSVPPGALRRDAAWELLRRLLAPGSEITNTCARCGGPHGPVRTSDASTRPAIAYAGDVAVVAVAGAGPGSFALDAEVQHDPVRDAAGLDGVLGGLAAPHLREWVRVEAALKADGRGLRVDPGDVAVVPVGVGEWRATVPGGGEVMGWDLNGPPHLLISVAFSAGGEEARDDPAMR